MINVKKRDGTLEPLNVDKINKWVEWACEGTSVPWSDIVTQTHTLFFDGITTLDIQSLLIKECERDVQAWSTDRLKVAAKLLLSDLRKKVYGDYVPHSLIEQIALGQHIGIYDKEPAFDLLEQYSYEQLEDLEDYIDHSRDNLHPYCGLQTLMDKYLAQNRSTGRIYETPQMMYMLIAMTGALKYKGEKRLIRAKSQYDKLSQGKCNLPTPITAGMRTPLRQFASCCLIDIDDSMPSLSMADHAAFTYTGARAGLGLNYGRIRREGASIRHGEVRHTGLIPFLKKTAATTKSCTQNGVRGGGGTINIPIWHYDFESLVVLKNIKGSEENRVRTLDYCWHYNGFLIERLQNKQDITLFSPHEVKDLYEAFYSSDTTLFGKLYEQYENDPTISKKVLPAVKVFGMLADEMLGTGRAYTLAADHVNVHSAFQEAVYMTNLCVEINLPTHPIPSLDDISVINPNPSQGEIALCVLGGIPWGNITLEEMYEIIYDQLDLLDQVFDMQTYVVKAAEHAKERRAVGIGIIDYAHFLAQRGLKYGEPEALNLTHRWMEHMQYCLIKAAVELAKERGACGYFHKTKYAQGILPIDTYTKTVDTLHTQKLLLDWDALRVEIATHGMRFSTLTAHMPSESSSVIWGFTNGMEPPRKIITVKSSKKGDLIVPVPNAGTLALDYSYAYPNDFNCYVMTNDDYLKTIAIVQKFSDQAVSYNRYYDFSKKTTIKQSTLLMDFFIKPHYYGIKTGYYTNSNVEEGTITTMGEDDPACAGGGCSV